MVQTTEELTGDIRRHYDSLSSFYQLLWGPHIHHGYWQADEGPREAQVRLIERLARRLEVGPGRRVLDIGCGVGGSTCWLAQRMGCAATGLTLSPQQVKIARRRAATEHVEDRVRFMLHDANELDLAQESFDAIWIIECSEHIHDKMKFFANCARLLERGGRLGLCVWLAGTAADRDANRLVRDVCEAMLCPSLLTMSEQVETLRAAGLTDIDAEDITDQVLPTWGHCIRLAKNPMVRMISQAAPEKLRRFLESFELMDRAYRTGAMAYGMITARKP